MLVIQTIISTQICKVKIVITQDPTAEVLQAKVHMRLTARKSKIVEKGKVNFKIVMQNNIVKAKVKGAM